MQVTCQQLGFSFVVGVTTMSSYGSTGDDVPVWVEGVDCEGGEGDIGECVRMGEWGAVSSDCENHTRDAGVVCAGQHYSLRTHHTSHRTLLADCISLLLSQMIRMH